METKLQELIGQPNVWLYIKSSNGWVKNVEILEVESDTITFRYQHESAEEMKIWEKTTRLDNILEIDLRLVALPKCDGKMRDVRSNLSRLLEQE